MPKFIINYEPQPRGEHEVHNLDALCSHLPKMENRIDLGYHYSCREAIAYARKRWPDSQIDGCYYCCRECHTR